MTATLRRTPCIGICSTTYGDLVCRGCKRFSHEIVQWNGFSESQRTLVWERLYNLREGAVLKFVGIADEVLLLSRAHRLRVPELQRLTLPNVAYEVLRRGEGSPLAALGLRSLAGDCAVPELFQRIESELYERAIAQYERDFRVSAL